MMRRTGKVQQTEERSGASAMPRGALGVVVWAVAWAGCAAALPEPSAADLALARADEPGVALADLERGRAAYAKRCGSCHALRSPTERPPETWPAEVTRMQSAHAVRLTPEEERDILRYLRAASALARQAPPSK